MSPRRLTLLAAVALLAAGCGVDPQAAPEDLEIPPIPEATAGAPGGTAGSELVLWFLRDDRLSPVPRSAVTYHPVTALALLAEGLTAREADEGLTTAISRQPLAVSTSDEATNGEDVLTVEVTEAFTGVAGADQLRAVAQVVWTATEFGEVDAVRFATADGSVEVPTDTGLTDDPVDRGDYASLAPDGPVAVD